MKYWTYIHHYTVDIQVSELQFDLFAKPTSWHRTKIGLCARHFSTSKLPCKSQHIAAPDWFF